MQKKWKVRNKMHRCTILLVKAENIFEAFKRVEKRFLNNPSAHQNEFDWYEFGGRWETLLDDSERCIDRLKNCLPVVKKWNETEEDWTKKAPKDNSFYFGCPVYNVETLNRFIPDYIENYWAIVIDFHF